MLNLRISERRELSVRPIVPADRYERSTKRTVAETAAKGL
jgi:hypothetical protein